MLKKKTAAIGLVFSLLLAVGTLILSLQFINNHELVSNAIFHAGMDALGAFVCAILYFGCMRQVEYSTRSFIILILMNNASFAIDTVLWFVRGRPDHAAVFLACCVLIKFLNLAMIYYFYLYVRNSLHFVGKLVKLADRWLPILMGLSMLIVLANAFFPLTFLVDANGHYVRTGLNWLEDLYLIIAATTCTILICRSTSHRWKKMAALSFILIPIIEFVGSNGAFAYATQYSAVLLSLILMYCILFNDRSRKLASTQTELTMATKIQAAMLPSSFPAFPDRTEFDLYASMSPAKEVGGDFYDFFLIDDNHLGLIIGDVSGKGVPAALLMMISKAMMRNYSKEGISPAEILKKTNDFFCSENKTDMFVTAWVGILETDTGILTCANAGHEYPAVFKNGKFELLKDKHGFILGGLEGMKYQDYELRLDPGDKVFVYTDGVTEATNPSKTLFGTDRMLKALNSDPAASPADILRTVRRHVDAFVTSAEQFDDLTMLCLEYRGQL